MAKTWTDDELNFLIFAYPSKDFTIDEISEALNVTCKDIRKKANILGLKEYKEVLPTGYKRCTICKIILPIDYFNNHKIVGKQTFCKSCNNDKQKEYQKRRRGGDSQSTNSSQDLEYKICSKCGIKKTKSEFYNTKGTCKDCIREYDRKRVVRGGY